MKQFVLNIAFFIFCVFMMKQNEVLGQQANVRASYKPNLMVSKDGSGDYSTIQEAIDAVRAYTPVPVTIRVKKGFYHEKISIPSWVSNLTIIGEDKENTIVAFEDYAGKFFDTDTVKNKNKHTTFTSATWFVDGNDITIENLTIRNDAGRIGQAVALHVNGSRFILRNCRLIGNQDTLFATNDESKQYYDHCYIEGTTDFIFGSATAVFDFCIIKSLTNSYITAASTMPHQKYGYVFLHCDLIAGKECTQTFLGRPWRTNAKTVFLNCNMGKHIQANGWHNWDRTENEKTAFYAEFQNRGEGADTSNRVKWSYQLNSTMALQYTIQTIFEQWTPKQSLNW
jgi:pectinesterase